MDRVLRYNTSVETPRKERHFVGSDELFFRSHRCGNSRINERVFARNRNTYPPFSRTRKELEEEHFIFSLRTIEQRSER